MLFYGFGSKKALLESFARECLTDGGVVVFNGYMRSLHIREILLKVASLLRVPRYLSLTSQSKMKYIRAAKFSFVSHNPGPFCRRPAGLLSMIDRLTGCFASTIASMQETDMHAAGSPDHQERHVAGVL